MPGLYWLKIDALPTESAQAIKGYEDYAAALTDQRIVKMRQEFFSSKVHSCMFDILHSTAGKEGIEGFSYPELQNESSLLITTGEYTVPPAYLTRLTKIRN
jgi:hypothetical protein